mgnify:CR=1 FL=1
MQIVSGELTPDAGTVWRDTGVQVARLAGMPAALRAANFVSPAQSRGHSASVRRGRS